MTPEMWGSLIGVFTASLLGSWHCAGMCGPFGVLLKNSAHPRIAAALYHGGRLISYSILAMGFQWLSKPFQFFMGQWIFVFLLAAWLILLFREMRWLAVQAPQWMAKSLYRLTKESRPWAALMLGLGTGLLPCGWLYGFLILGSSRSQWVERELLVSVFWAGTLPALALSQVWLARLTQRVGMRARIASALIVTITGVWSTVIHRDLLSPTLFSPSLLQSLSKAKPSGGETEPLK